MPIGIKSYTKQKQMHPNNHDRPITNPFKKPYPNDCQKKTKTRRKEKVEENEDSKIFCLKTPFVSVVHLDHCGSAGRQDKGAPSPGEEFLEEGNWLS